MQRLTPLSSAAQGFHDRLRLVRLWRGMSQKAFAEEIGASPPRYNHWEKGRHPPTIEHMIRMRELWEIPLDWIYVGEHRHMPTLFTQFVVSYGARSDAPAEARRVREQWGRASGFLPSQVAPDDVAETILRHHPAAKPGGKPVRRTLHEDDPKPPD